jgi:hypothetical protein
VLATEVAVTCRRERRNPLITAGQSSFKDMVARRGFEGPAAAKVPPESQHCSENSNPWQPNTGVLNSPQVSCKKAQQHNISNSVKCGLLTRNQVFFLIKLKLWSNCNLLPVYLKSALQ